MNRLQATYLARSHHHTTSDSVERVGRDTSTSGDRPAEQERGQEVALKWTDEDDWLERIVHTEVQTTVDDNSENRRTETTVETHDTVRSEGLLVDVNQTVELAVTSGFCVLGIVGKTGTGIVERVDEEEGGCTSSLDIIHQH